jgi:hypothetical protein
VVKLLLDRGANLTIADFMGTTPLYYCKAFNLVDIHGIVTLLISKGVNVHVTSQPIGNTFSPVQWIGETISYCDTPSNWAVDTNRYEIDNTLLDYGADPMRDDGLFEQNGKLDLEMTSGGGAFSALHFAFQRLKADMLQLFFRQAAIKTAALSAGLTSFRCRRP